MNDPSATPDLVVIPPMGMYTQIVESQTPVNGFMLHTTSSATGKAAELLDSRPAEVDAVAIDALRALGYTDREILDVVGLVALNVLTGTFNLVAGLEPKPPTPDPLRRTS